MLETLERTADRVRTLNDDYLFEQTKRLFKKQKIKKSIKRAALLLENEQVDEAQDVLREGAKPEVESQELGVNALDPKTIKEILKRQKKDRVSITFGIPTLDRLVGPLKSEWFIMFMGPMARGKTLALTHMAVQAIIGGRNAVLFSLESGEEDTAQRLWQNIGSLDNRGGEIQFPLFEKSGKWEKEGKQRIVEYEELEGVEWKEEKRPGISFRSIIKKVDEFVRRNRIKRVGELRVKSFPAYTAGVGDIKTVS